MSESTFQIKQIPEAYQALVIHQFWLMLKTLESKALDSSDRKYVESLYVTWNQITGDQAKPLWLMETVQMKGSFADSVQRAKNGSF